MYKQFGDRNFVTGRFLKGRTPFNKGVEWDAWMPEEKRNKVLSQLEKGRKRKGETAPMAGWNARKVVYLDEYGNPHILPSAAAAGRKFNAPGRNIRLCCDGKRKRVHGMTFYWADRNEWASVIAENEQRTI